MELFRKGMTDELWFALLHKDIGSPISVGDPKVPVSDVLEHFAGDLSPIALRNRFPQLSPVEIAACFCAAAEVHSPGVYLDSEMSRRVMLSLNRDLTRKDLKQRLPEITDEQISWALKTAAAHYRNI